MKKIRKATAYSDFLKAVRLCSGDVCFCTPEGDRLNLKSQLSEYLFVVAAHDSDLLENGYLVCENPADLNALARYLEGDE